MVFLLPDEPFRDTGAVPERATTSKDGYSRGQHCVRSPAGQLALRQPTREGSGTHVSINTRYPCGPCPAGITASRGSSGDRRTLDDCAELHDVDSAVCIRGEQSVSIGGRSEGGPVPDGR